MRPTARIAALTALVAIAPVGIASVLAALTRTGSRVDWTDVLTIAGGVGIVLAAVAAVMLTRWTAEPMRQITEAADRIARGDRSVQLDGRGGGESERLVTAFNRMSLVLESAEKKLRRAERIAAWRDIARQMAHEIKNPLTPIQMAVEMLRKARDRELPDFDALFDEQTKIILEEVARLRRLVENFSRFARAQRLRLEDVSMEDLVAHVVGLHAGNAEVEVTGDVAADMPVVRADREQLTQVLVNIVGNASQAAVERRGTDRAGDPAAVHVAATRMSDGRVSIAVEDNGAGVPDEVMQRLFEPYVTTKPGGTGLGLAIAWRIVNEHGGTIAVDTSKTGSRFEIVLPPEGPTLHDATLDTQDSVRWRKDG